MPSPKDSARFGVAQRNHLGRADLALLAKRKFDPLDVIQKACRGHVPRLVPVKFQRMSESPFAFFRGAVEVMAADLGAGKHTGIEVQLCGDAHVKNFGFFAAPDQHVVLDVNDFDETQRGPWEWDVKRMAASIVVAGRFAGDSDRLCKQAAGIFLNEYCAWIHRFAGMSALDVARHRALRESSSPLVRGALKEAERSSPAANLQKLTRPAGSGSRRFMSKPGLIWEITGREKKAVLAALPEYRKTLSPDHQRLLDRYEPVDVAFKVVGTGSVGTRDYVVLMLGANQDADRKKDASRKTPDPLFLQIKEEPPSAYAPYYKDASAPPHQGQRVVHGQRALQVLSDLLLGWCTIDRRDYLVRQLNDHKSSIDPEKLKGNRLAEYSRICAELLAKGHARSGSPAALAGYLGNSPKAGKALLQFAVKYADQTEADFQAFSKAMKKGFVAKVVKSL
jgi:uncharacterized protein (DUF2252 family)